MEMEVLGETRSSSTPARTQVTIQVTILNLPHVRLPIVGGRWHNLCVFPFRLLLYVLATSCFIFMLVRPDHI
jgi:hypothetical protein